VAPRPDLGGELALRRDRAGVLSRRWAFGALVERAIDDAAPVDVDDFQELRRCGLFRDDGRNPPPGWWSR
jgi:hypothetical protein